MVGLDLHPLRGPAGLPLDVPLDAEAGDGQAAVRVAGVALDDGEPSELGDVPRRGRENGDQIILGQADLARFPVFDLESPGVVAGTCCQLELEAQSLLLHSLGSPRGQIFLSLFVARTACSP